MVWSFHIPRGESRVLKSESFLELPWPLVLTLARDGELQVDEADLFKAVQAWVARSPTERRRHVDEARVCGVLGGCFFPLVYMLQGSLLLLIYCCSVCSTVCFGANCRVDPAMHLLLGIRRACFILWWPELLFVHFSPSLSSPPT